jgi:hypothetical protein
MGRTGGRIDVARRNFRGDACASDSHVPRLFLLVYHARDRLTVVPMAAQDDVKDFTRSSRTFRRVKRLGSIAFINGLSRKARASIAAVSVDWFGKMSEAGGCSGVTIAFEK